MMHGHSEMMLSSIADRVEHYGMCAGWMMTRPSVIPARRIPEGWRV